MAEETTPAPEPTPEVTGEAPAETPSSAKKSAAKAKPASENAPAKPPKKEKPPAIEEKPFAEFIEQHFTPALKSALANRGATNVKLSLFQAPIPIAGYIGTEACWQLTGDWQEKRRQFNLYFLDGNISGQKAFSYSVNGKAPSTLESFMIDERKITLDLMVLYALQRLNGQKWFGDN
jgi:hypothetical protein